MTFSFSTRSINNFKGVHPDLVRVAYRALTVTPLDFGVIEGLRTGERQHQLFLAGKTQRDWPPPPGQKVGRHLGGFAVDFLVYIEGVATETDLDAYAQVAQAFKDAASVLNIKIHWGGDWPHFKDYDHIELDETIYPDQPLVA